MSDALSKVKQDLGKDAVILHTRTFKRGGMLGLGARSIVEITATADDRVMALRKGAAESNRRPSPRASAPPRRKASKSLEAPPNGAPKPQVAGGRSSVEPRPSLRSAPSVQSGSTDAALRQEVGEIRNMVRDLLQNNRRMEHPDVPEKLLDHYTQLIGQDVAGELALELVGRVADRLGLGAPARSESEESDGKSATVTPRRIQEELREALVEMLPSAAPLMLNETETPTVVALIGPTGVGKTTTIAKLAANMRLREKRKVGLITIDTYRIAAVEQIKTYAQIMKIPIVSVLAPEEMRPAIEQLSDMDLILIDTAGRSQRDDVRIAELAAFLEVAKPDQTHLVLSSTCGEKILNQAIERFSPLGAKHIIFTKLDEAVGLGVILNVVKRMNIRLSYLTDGQAVPDDIQIGSAGRVARLLLGIAESRKFDGRSIEAETARQSGGRP